MLKFPTNKLNNGVKLSFEKNRTDIKLSPETHLIETMFRLL